MVGTSIIRSPYDRRRDTSRADRSHDVKAATMEDFPLVVGEPIYYCGR